MSGRTNSERTQTLRMPPLRRDGRRSLTGTCPTSLPSITSGDFRIAGIIGTPPIPRLLATLRLGVNFHLAIIQVDYPVDRDASAGVHTSFVDAVGFQSRVGDLDQQSDVTRPGCRLSYLCSGPRTNAKSGSGSLSLSLIGFCTRSRQPSASNAAQRVQTVIDGYGMRGMLGHLAGPRCLRAIPRDRRSSALPPRSSSRIARHGSGTEDNQESDPSLRRGGNGSWTVELPYGFHNSGHV